MVSATFAEMFGSELIKPFLHVSNRDSQNPNTHMKETFPRFAQHECHVVRALLT